MVATASVMKFSEAFDQNIAEKIQNYTVVTLSLIRTHYIVTILYPGQVYQINRNDC